MEVLLGNQAYFKHIVQINYEGVASDNPLVFRWYDAIIALCGENTA